MRRWALLLAVGLLAGCGGGGQSAQEQAAVKMCRALADGYSTGFLPGSAGLDPSSASAFFVDLANDSEGLLPGRRTDANGVPVTSSVGQERASVRFVSLWSDTLGLDASSLPLSGTKSASLGADCAAFGVRWRLP